MDHLIWTPGTGVDTSALKRIRSHFGRPKEPMGEAWFMGEERRLFHELKGDLLGLNAYALQEPLEEIASGTSSFGPHKEWNDWYHYLLGHLVPRNHECSVSSLLESLITCFIALYPNGFYKTPYPQFPQDVLQTLGQCMMEPQCWDAEEIVIGSMLHRSNKNPNQVWCWWDASGDFSASIFFCIKYLPPSLISDWFSSALAIKSPHWRAQVLVWLVGAHDILSGEIAWPSEFSLEARPYVGWEWSHCLKPELAAADESGAPAVSSLLPGDSRANVLEVAHSYFTEEVFLLWLDSIARVPYLEQELAEIPSTFESLYVQRR
jgi:hypothetical protein